MRRVIGATLAGALLAAFAVLGCDRGSTALAQSTGGDSGIGQPNPMPGSPIADSGTQQRRKLTQRVRRCHRLIARRRPRSFPQRREALAGQIVEGGNPFEGPRVSDYPNKPLIMSQAGFIFTDAAKKLGFHPFPTPSSNNSAPYTNIEGQTLGQCQYCGHCEYFGCESNSKASPNICIMPVLMADSRFELRTHAYVKNLVYDKPAKKVRGVVYIDRETGEPVRATADGKVTAAGWSGGETVRDVGRSRSANRCGGSGLLNR